MRLLILGGTTEASAIARGLAAEPGIRATLSLAGRTRAPAVAPVPTRIGGFGGVEGLARYLRDERVAVLVDATHPFAAQMSRHAAAAARQTGTALLPVVRPAWTPQPGDRWTSVPDMRGAAAALGPTPRRVFLTVGQQELAPFRAAPWHRYLIRSVEPIPDPPPGARCVTARGPFAEADEHALLAAEGVEVLVTKNSGGGATAAKLAAARMLGVGVVMVERPAAPSGPSAPDAVTALAWLRRHAAERGV
jgi:precorrin-6A/cobalt-precorrin-6A reductase